MSVRLLAILFTLHGAALAAESDPLLDTLGAEIDRAAQALKSGANPPTFISTELTDVQWLSIIAEDGALQGYAPDRARFLEVDVRVGTPALDSSHPLRDDRSGDGPGSGTAVPLDDDPALLRRALWREIDRRYNAARERWAKVESERKTLVAEEGAVDLAPVKVEKSLEPLAVLEFGPKLELKGFEETLRRASALLGDSEVVQDGSVTLMATIENRWFASSEGTRLRHAEARYRIAIRVDGQTADGEQLSLFESFDAGRAEDLPAPEVLFERTKALERDMTALQRAPEQAPYSGPAILTGRAAAVFFHEILGHRLEGQRLKQISDAQTFRSMLQKPILPDFLSVRDDPTLERFGDVFLNGHYRFDNQGVPAMPTSLVERGVLRGFLESRSTSGPGITSNGHGRRQRAFDPVARQGVLIVEAHQRSPEAALRRELLRLVQKEKLPYGLVIEDISGGFTFTGRSMPNSFNVTVVLARRVYPDGRPDELIRGANLIGTPLVTFSRIVMASDTTGVFNGYCGAESGSVPNSAVSPALLLSQIETQRKTKGQQTQPLLPAPRSGKENAR